MTFSCGPLFLSGIGDFFLAGVMRLKVNGEEYTTGKDTVTQLLKELDIIPERVAVEVNLKIIRRADFDSCRLKEGDSIEVISFVGGGQQERK